MLPNSEWILLALFSVILLKPADILDIAKFLAKSIRYAQHLWNDLVINEIDSTPKESNAPLKKHPFHLSPSKAKSQPVKL